MNLNRAKTFAIASASALFLLTGTASAAILSGGTDQPGQGITLKTRGDGSVKSAEITWKANCNTGQKPTGSTRYTFKRSSPQGFRAGGKQVKKKKNATYTYRTSIEADAKGAGYSGTFKLKLKAVSRGKTFARCKTGKIRWSAS